MGTGTFVIVNRHGELLAHVSLSEDSIGWTQDMDAAMTTTDRRFYELLAETLRSEGIDCQCSEVTNES